MKFTSKILMATAAMVLMSDLSVQAADTKAEVKKETTKAVVLQNPPASTLTPGMDPQQAQVMMHNAQNGAAGNADGNMIPPQMDYLYGNAMKGMHEQMMMVRPSGDTDVDFVQGMLPHHEGAVAMAKIVLEKGKDPEIKKLATEIIKSQEAEIKMMSEWLAAKNAPKNKEAAAPATKTKHH